MGERFTTEGVWVEWLLTAVVLAARAPHGILLQLAGRDDRSHPPQRRRGGRGAADVLPDGHEGGPLQEAGQEERCLDSLSRFRHRVSSGLGQSAGLDKTIKTLTPSLPGALTQCRERPSQMMKLTPLNLGGLTEQQEALQDFMNKHLGDYDKTSTLFGGPFYYRQTCHSPLLPLP